MREPMVRLPDETIYADLDLSRREWAKLIAGGIIGTFVVLLVVALISWIPA